MDTHLVDGSTSIALHVETCFAAFYEVSTRLKQAGQNIRDKIPKDAVNDELGRFRLWCGNIAAHRKGKSSLDYRLREASHIRDRVMDLLRSLESALQEAMEIISGQRIPWEDLSDSDSDISDASTPLADTTELQQLASNVAQINTMLMRLSMSIRNPAPHDQFKESKHIDMTYYETFDIDHVRGKFPQADQFLTLRLGRAISRRRQYLRYREDHRNKLAKGLEDRVEEEPGNADADTLENEPALTEHMPSTVASSVPSALKAQTAIALDEEMFEDTLSQTSYASSSTNPVKLRPPPLPEQGQDGDPFECPLCFRFTSVRHTFAWHKHVYRDLQPYLMSSCERTTSMDSPARCSLCLETCLSLVQLRRHMGKHHEELALFALPSHLHDDRDASDDDDCQNSQSLPDSLGITRFENAHPNEPDISSNLNLPQSGSLKSRTEDDAATRENLEASIEDADTSSKGYHCQCGRSYDDEDQLRYNPTQASFTMAYQ
ncbi:hypothetical protein BS50DRAFT_508529 [Corynespora cassiicola Philippines]|uniref:Oxidoreductase acuF-like C2H2 type zinc-finger domain-containing protein n=1 Tax=Corynespora cassiicola Philippines TaxID=1448308 RepID=A0A2T2N1V4_CORCC|nr:hypothetical protein BS50DRAFT_508529 [Corynespora cassiicola Philippines]